MKATKMLFWLFSVMFLVGTSCHNDEIMTKESQDIMLDIELDMKQRSMVKQGNVFANTFLMHVTEKNENTLISPFGLQAVLAMLANGANEEVYNEILSTLGMTYYTQSELNEFYRKMLTSLGEEEDPKVELSLANSMWIQNNYIIQENYISKMEETYEATVKNIDFKSLEAAKASIDDWARKKTNSTIKNLNLPIEESTIMVLANVLYFSGKWQTPFSKSNTYNDNFMCEDGTIQTVPFMHGLKKNVAYMETDCFQWVSLPFGNRSFSMNILLPKKEENLEDVISEAEWGTTSDTKYISVNIAMPRFKMEVKKELKDILQRMGITKIFGNGSLPKISDGLFVSFLQQNAYLEIEESGVEASNVTSSGSVPTAPEITYAEMNLNRPFVFAICENSTNAVLFMGKIANI